MATSVNPNGRFTSAVSFNIRGIQLSGDKLKVRMILLYDYVNIHSVDELHLQEVFTYEILRELIKNMPHFKHVVYEKGVAGPKGGLVSFYRELPELVKFYPLTPSLAARLDPLWIVPYIHKGVLVTHLSHRRLRCNLHLDPNRTGDWENVNEKTALISQQLQQVARTIDDLIQRNHPMSLLVFGDFNLPHKTQAYIDFMQDARLQDAFEGNYRPTYHATFLPKGRIPYQVDHVLVWSDRQLPKFLKRSQYILTNPSRHDNRNIYASDHVGLAVDIDSTA